MRKKVKMDGKSHQNEHFFAHAMNTSFILLRLRMSHQYDSYTSLSSFLLYKDICCVLKTFGHPDKKKNPSCEREWKPTKNSLRFITTQSILNFWTFFWHTLPSLCSTQNPASIRNPLNYGNKMQWKCCFLVTQSIMKLLHEKKCWM